MFTSPDFEAGYTFTVALGAAFCTGNLHPTLPQPFD